jgi:PadR family transcriptional regulator PadR
LKGLLEGCILKLIEREETYGYKICEDLLKEGYKKINEGTIYPILIRLEKKGLINSTRRSSPLGPTRKYFNITENGREYLRAFEYEWNEIKKIVDKFVGGKGGKKDEGENE